MTLHAWVHQNIIAIIRVIFSIIISLIERYGSEGGKRGVILRIN